MANARWYRRRGRRDFSIEGLESRGLLSAGLVGPPALVRELGPVSREAALVGVAATAAIPSGSAVTFQFEVQAGGSYTLLVRHDGGGLDLTAKGPNGSGSIDAGAAGSFHVVSLALTPGTYDITATARDGRPVFVDWELLLNSGVGQVAGTAPGAILPLTSTSAPAAGGLAGSGATTFASIGSTGGMGMGMVPAGEAHASASLELASSARPLVGDLMGRASDDPATPPTVVATVPDVGRSPSELTLAQHETALLIGLQPGAGTEGVPEASPARVDPSWFAELTRAVAGEAPVAPAAEPAPIVVAPELLAALPAGDPPVEPGTSLASIQPGVLVGAVALTFASRRFFKRRSAGLGPVIAGKPTPRGFLGRPGRGLD